MGEGEGRGGCERKVVHEVVYSLSLLTSPSSSILSPPSSTAHQEKAQGRNAHYKLTSTVMLWLQTIKAGSGTMNLGGSLTRQNEQDYAVNDASPHIANIGRMVEVRALCTSTVCYCGPYLWFSFTIGHGEQDSPNLK